jgi:hypothetical protein
MIDFYYKFFRKTYKAKINELILDIKSLLLIENININQTYKIILNKKFTENLDNEIWNELNQLFFTLEANKNNISPTLLKFINKTNITKSFKFIDTFAGCG